MIIYSTQTCTRCKFLKDKLKEKGLDFDVCMDTDVMAEKGIQTVPVIELDDGKRLNFAEALKYVEVLSNGH